MNRWLRLAVRLLPQDVRKDVAVELGHRFDEIAAGRGRVAARRWARRQPLVALMARLRWARPPLEPHAGGATLAGWRDDAAVAVRGVRRRMGLAVAVIATVAVSVGAIGAIASVVDAVLLRPLPYPGEERLVWINSVNRSAAPGPSAPFIGQSNPLDVVDWRQRNRTFDAIAAIEAFDGTILPAGDPVRVNVGKMSVSTGRVLGIRAVHGRLFTDADDDPGVRVMVLTQAVWRSHFGGDPAVVGRSVLLDGTPFLIVGVLPPLSVPFPDADVDVWMPLPAPSPLANPRERRGVWQRVIGRIAPTSTRAGAQADLDRVAAELAAEHPDTNGTRAIALVPFRDGLVGSTREVLWMLSSAIVVVLVIACANVGHLLLVSVQARRREFAVRAALGARTARIARLVLLESAVLAVLGGAAGLLLAPWLLRAFLVAYPAELPAVGAVVLSPVAFVAAGAATLVAVLASAVPPLFGARAADLTRSMRATDRGSDSRGQRRARAALVVAQVAMSTALLVGGGLLLRTFLDIRATPLGFADENVLIFNVALSDTHYASRAAETAFFRDLTARVRVLPGVTAVGASSLLPLTEGDFIDGFGRIGEQDAYPNLPTGRLQNVTPGYFDAIGLPQRAGRRLTEADADGAAPVVVVNETLERRYFPDGAVGRQIRLRGTTREIVGVVADKRHRSLREAPRADLYVPRAQADWPRWFSWIAVRHAGGVEALDALVPAVRAAVRDVDPRIAVDGIGTMADRVARTLAPDRFRAVLVGALAAVALLLAVVGLYGLVAYAVARDARDTAIRVALGATAARTVGGVLRRVAALTAIGIAAGLGLALTSQDLLASFVAGISVRDPLTMGVVAGGLLLAAILAAAGPAIRASRVDPALVLRGQ